MLLSEPEKFSLILFNHAKDSYNAKTIYIYCCYYFNNPYPWPDDRDQNRTSRCGRITDCARAEITSSYSLYANCNIKRRVAIRCNLAHGVPVGDDEIEIDLLPETRSPIMYRHVVLWVTLSTADGQQLKATVHLWTVCPGTKVPTTRKGQNRKNLQDVQNRLHMHL